MNPSACGKLRVVVIGAGYFAGFHLEAWRRLADEGLVELAGLVEPDADRRQVAIERFGIPAGSADLAGLLARSPNPPGLLDIATPPATHLELVGAAARAGIDCICQKPLAPSEAEAEQLVAVAGQAGIRLTVHENFRWMPWYGEMKRCLNDGRLGDVHTISVRMRPGDGQGPDAYLARQPYFQKMPRFWVHETAIHFIDCFRFLLGEVTAVTARLRRLNPAIAGEDAGYIVLEFGNGPTALIDGNRLNDHPADNTRLTMGEHWLEGSRGVMRLDGNGGLFWKPHGETERPHPYAWSNRGFGGDCVYRQQRHLVEAWQANRAPVNSGRDYLRNIAIEEAVYRSAAEGRRIDMN